MSPLLLDRSTPSLHYLTTPGSRTVQVLYVRTNEFSCTRPQVLYILCRAVRTSIYPTYVPVRTVRTYVDYSTRYTQTLHRGGVLSTRTSIYRVLYVYPTCTQCSTRIPVQVKVRYLYSTGILVYTRTVVYLYTYCIFPVGTKLLLVPVLVLQYCIATGAVPIN